MYLHLLRIPTLYRATLGCRTNQCVRNILLTNRSLDKCNLQSFVHVRHFSLANGWSNLYYAVCNNDTVLSFQDKLIIVNQTYHVPWWVIITSTTIILRLCLLPLVVHQHKVNAKYAMVIEELNTTVNRTVNESVRAKAAKENWSQIRIDNEFYSKLSDERTELIEKHNCHPGKNLALAILQMPLWMGASGIYRNIINIHPVADDLAIQAHMNMQHESFLWIANLTIPDNTYTLPIILTVTHMMNVQFNAKTRKFQSCLFTKVVTYTCMAISVGMGYIACFVPSCISFYWVISSIYGLVQNLFFLSPSVRQMFRIPTPSNMRLRPHIHIKNKLSSFFMFIKH